MKVNRWRAAAAAVVALVAGFGLVAPPAQADEVPKIPDGSLIDTAYNFVQRPAYTAGANDWGCRPTEGNNPVILLPGTFANAGANFTKLGPRIKNAGFCTFTLNYGATGLSLDGRVGGLGPVADSARELGVFVDKVLAATGAPKVNIVGHSQGGLLPTWYIRRLGGASKVDKYVGLAPSNRGTELWGIVALGKALGIIGFVGDLSKYAQVPGLLDQASDSPAMKELWSGSPDMPAGPQYTVISTRYDQAVHPISLQKLSGPNTRNVLVQDYCPFNLSGHMGVAFDEPTLQLTLNALKGGPSTFRPSCGFGTDTALFGLPFS